MDWSVTCLVCLTACPLAENNGSFFTLRREGSGGSKLFLMSSWRIGLVLYLYLSSVSLKNTICYSILKIRIYTCIHSWLIYVAFIFLNLKIIVAYNKYVLGIKKKFCLIFNVIYLFILLTILKIKSLSLDISIYEEILSAQQVKEMYHRGVVVSYGSYLLY